MNAGLRVQVALDQTIAIWRGRIDSQQQRQFSLVDLVHAQDTRKLATTHGWQSTAKSIWPARRERDDLYRSGPGVGPVLSATLFAIHQPRKLALIACMHG